MTALQRFIETLPPQARASVSEQFALSGIGPNDPLVAVLGALRATDQTAHLESNWNHIRSATDNLFKLSTILRSIKRRLLVGVIATALIVGIILGTMIGGYFRQSSAVGDSLMANGFQLQLTDGPHPEFRVIVPTTYGMKTDWPNRTLTFQSHQN